MRIKEILAAAVLLIAMMATCSPLSAQQTTSPYSMYGYGLLGDRATSMQTQMGGIGYAMQNGRQINVMNPASYAAIDSLTFLWDMGADLSFAWRKQAGAKDKVTGGGLDYVTMQFPICSFIGGSAGVVPYSSVGYAFGDEVAHGALQNQGSGGINEAYLGFAGKAGGFSFGFNLSYDFGNIQNDVFTNPAGGGQTLFEQIMQVRDWNVLFGAQYRHPLGKWDRLTLGVTFSPKQSMHGKTWVTMQETSQESLPDTVGHASLKNRNYTPNSFGVGLNWTHEKASRLSVEADFTWQQWSKAPYAPLHADFNPEIVVFEGMRFNDRMKLAVGGEYVPNIRGNYLQRTAYRLGAYVARDYLVVQGNSIREYGVSGGFGFHTPGDKTMVNLGVAWKHRQAHPSPLVRENDLMVTLGLNFNELWFWQRKIR